jgi:superfamily II DNA or RNA helicase/HKD family nuclease
LLVPHRHVATWFEATVEEQQELLQAIEMARDVITKTYPVPDGFNIGINVGEAAGQTVFHLHVHVIPRYKGDVPDPTGGVRAVIPGKANYRRGPAAQDHLLGQAPHHRALVRGGGDPLLPHLLAELDRAERADIAVAFVLRSGIRRILEHLRDLLDRGGRVRLLTGDYLDVTDPQALWELSDLDGNLDLRVYEAAQTGFHPKAYIFYGAGGEATAYVGSSNLTQSALETGVEWNYRIVSSKDGTGFADITEAFAQLYRDPATRPLDASWITRYQARRRPPAVIVPVEVKTEAPELPPEPHEIQQQALAGLTATRAAGNSAGLVVLATGLGKTWLSAYDSSMPEFQRVLFVAHRDEILTQAMQTYRRIRPTARLGRYTGKEKLPDSEVLFASIQTLGRQQHLNLFEPDSFDYIVVDEFHHAAARTYRRLIDYFDPKFLLGLTATPERMDGGDLLGLCQENLVFRCDVMAGIRQGLLCPFHYFGVPDEVDYANIPWRNSRFDEEQLTRAVATRSRAQNALEQYKQRAGSRTLGFCCSQRHADFMADFFNEAGVCAAAVHSGPTSSPRATSLEQLAAGDLDIIFAVDMFNEGIDIPAIDTVMMLRPTESSTIWLQQFGRGLRLAPDKSHLTVIDYIGNHRTFLLKPRTLFQLGPGDGAVSAALKMILAGQADLPPGCEVTYDSVAVDILRALLRAPSPPEALRSHYADFRELRGQRPTATEVFHEGFNPRAVRKTYGSWLRFVNAMGDLPKTEQTVFEEAGGFLDNLETTPMTKTFKMLTVLAMLNTDTLPGRIAIDPLTEEFARIAKRSATLQTDVGPALGNHAELRRLIEANPINAWARGGRANVERFFAYEDSVFRTKFSVEPSLREAFRDMVREIVDWRLAEYLQRPGKLESPENSFVCRVIQSGGRPILKLPDRRDGVRIPQGWIDVYAGDRKYRANFVKVAVNVMTLPDSKENVLAEIMRSWFGENAGQPGTRFQVVIEAGEDGWIMRPVHAGKGEG